VPKYLSTKIQRKRFVHALDINVRKSKRIGDNLYGAYTDLANTVTSSFKGERFLLREDEKFSREILRQNTKELMFGLQVKTNKAVSESINRAFYHQQRIFRKMGLSSISMEEIKDFKKRAFMQYFKPFNGLTIEDRLNYLDKRIRTFGYSVLKKGKSISFVRQQLKGRLTYNIPGRSPYGASELKWGQRLVRSEAGRAYQEATVLFSKERGVPLVKWDLSSNHLDQHGVEICEKLANATPLEGEGLSVGNLSLRGVYYTDEAPTFPHPYCQCGLSPVYTALMARRREAFERAGLSPQEFSPRDLVHKGLPSIVIERAKRFASGETLALLDKMSGPTFRSLVREVAKMESVGGKGRMKTFAKVLLKKSESELKEAINSNYYEVENFVNAAFSLPVKRGAFDAMNGIAFQLLGQPAFTWEKFNLLGVENASQVLVEAIKQSTKTVDRKKLLEVLDKLVTHQRIGIYTKRGLKSVDGLLNDGYSTLRTMRKAGFKGKNASRVIADSLFSQAQSELGGILGSMNAVDQIRLALMSPKDVFVVLGKTRETALRRLETLGLQVKKDGILGKIGKFYQFKINPEKYHKVFFRVKGSLKSFTPEAITEARDGVKEIAYVGSRDELKKIGIDVLDIDDERFIPVKFIPPDEIVNAIVRDALVKSDPYSLGGSEFINYTNRIWPYRSRSKTLIDWGISADMAKNLPSPELLLKWSQGTPKEFNKAMRYLNVYIRKNVKTGKAYYVIPKWVRGFPERRKFYFEEWLDIHAIRWKRIKNWQNEFEDIKNNIVLKGGVFDRKILGIKEGITLKPVQRAAEEFIVQQKNVLLNAGVGFGKTPTSISAISDLISAGKVKRALVVVPSGTKMNWVSEIKKFSKYKGRLISGKRDIELKMLKNPGKYKIDVITHKDAASLVKELRMKYDMVVIDEIHDLTPVGDVFDYEAYSKESRILRDLVSKRIKYKVGLTGTAIKDNIGQMWDTIEWLQPGKTGMTKREFVDMFSGAKFGGRVFGGLTTENNFARPLMVKTFNSLFDDSIFVAKAPIRGIRLIDYFNEALPVEMRNKQLIKVKLTKVQKMEYRNLEKMYEIKKQELIRKGATKELVQLETHRRHDLMKVLRSGSGKDNAFYKEILKIAKKHPDDKIIIHTESNEVAKNLRNFLGKDRAVALTGSTKNMDVQKILKKFSEIPEQKFLILTSAKSEGINVQMAKVTIHLDLPKNFKTFIQRNGRNFRLGQDRDVYSYILTSDSPIDIMARNRIFATKRFSELIPIKQEDIGDTFMSEMLDNLKKFYIESVPREKMVETIDRELKPIILNLKSEDGMKALWFKRIPTTLEEEGKIGGELDFSKFVGKNREFKFVLDKDIFFQKETLFKIKGQTFSGVENLYKGVTGNLEVKGKKIASNVFRKEVQFVHEGGINFEDVKIIRVRNSKLEKELKKVFGDRVEGKNYINSKD